jgi:hypothetical protein
MTPTSASTLPQPGQMPYQTGPGVFNNPPPSQWQAPPPMQSVPVMPQSAYASYASAPQPKPRTVRWTLFIVWLIIGLGISLFGAAFIAVLAVGDDPPNSVVGALTLLLYLTGAIALFIWCKL